MKRPNPLAYVPLGGLLKLFAFFKGQRIIRKTKITRPAFLISNHTSFYDFIYTTCAVYPLRVTHVAADKMFYDPLLGFFLRFARAIPKPLFQSDPIATRRTIEIIRKGGVVAIFPEGQISAIGKTYEPVESIAKLFKKMRVDVYAIKHHNAYFVNPPWSKKSFPGRIETTIDKIFDANTVGDMTETAIYAAIQNALAFDAARFNALKMYSYRPNDIANLENVIYRCPICSHEGLENAHDRLVCPACHNEFIYDRYGKLSGRILSELFEAQEAEIKRRIDTNTAFCLESDVTLESYRDNLVVIVGQGHLTLDRDYYTYQGTVDGVMVVKQFKTKDVRYIPSDIGRNIQIYQEYMLYQFVMKDQKLPTIFVIAGEYLYRLHNAPTAEVSR